MTRYVGFLRGINVGGNSIIAMSDLRSLCEKAGLKNVSTYINSGNVMFESPLSESAVSKKLGELFTKKFGKEIPVAVRTVDDLIKVLEKNPFPDKEPARVGVMFFPGTVSKDFATGVSTSTGEEVKASKREVYIYFPIGMGKSKIKLPKGAQEGTVRNINTVQKVIDLSGA